MTQKIRTEETCCRCHNLATYDSPLLFAMSTGRAGGLGSTTIDQGLTKRCTKKRETFKRRSKMKCQACNKDCPPQQNYCNFSCLVDHAAKMGGVINSPNGLPVQCIDRNGNMWECEHADHPDYKFPVEIEYCGPPESTPRFVDGAGNPAGTAEANESLQRQTHALIYTDGHAAVTMHECTYAFWHVNDGRVAGGSLFKPGHWRLSAASIAKIRDQRK